MKKVILLTSDVLQVAPFSKTYMMQLSVIKETVCKCDWHLASHRTVIPNHCFWMRFVLHYTWYSVVL